MCILETRKYPTHHKIYEKSMCSLKKEYFTHFIRRRIIACSQSCTDTHSFIVPHTLRWWHSPSHFVDEETEAHNGERTRRRAQSSLAAEPGLRRRSTAPEPVPVCLLPSCFRDAGTGQMASRARGRQVSRAKRCSSGGGRYENGVCWFSSRTVSPPC